MPKAFLTIAWHTCRVISVFQEDRHLKHAKTLCSSFANDDTPILKPTYDVKRAHALCVHSLSELIHVVSFLLVYAFNINVKRWLFSDKIT